MPSRPAKPCAIPGCPELTRGRHCEVHTIRKQVDPYYVSKEWRALRKRALARDRWCTHPGCTARSTTADHIVPRRRGGADTMENLRGYCARHHSWKTLMFDGALGRRVTGVSRLVQLV